MYDKIIIANWKMNPQTTEEAIQLAKESDIEGLVICPPFPFLEEVKKTIKKAKLGAQDLFWEPQGAYTGEVSAKELKNLGVEYVIIGHSERRQNLGETDEIVAKKIKAAVEEGLTPILCVGETRAERDAGKTKEVVERELKVGLSLVGQMSKVKGQRLVIAYEPLWAIGENASAADTPADFCHQAIYLRKVLAGLFGSEAARATPILYGGSVDARNAAPFLRRPR